MSYAGVVPKANNSGEYISEHNPVKQGDLESEQVGKAVDYYIGITSESIRGNYFFRTRQSMSHFDRIFSIITSTLWREEGFSSPFVFEYISNPNAKILKFIYL
jgi:hypothetical protein